MAMGREQRLEVHGGIVLVWILLQFPGHPTMGFEKGDLL